MLKKHKTALSLLNAHWTVALCVVVLSGCVEHGHTQGSHSSEMHDASGSEFTAKLSHGEQALAAGDAADAQESFIATVRSGSSDSRAIIGLAESHLARGDHRRAGKLLTQLKTDSPGTDSARLYQAKGIIALRSDQPEEARRLFERSVDANASLWRAWVGLGRVYLMAGREPDARTAFVMAEQTAPQTASAQNDIGMTHLRLDNIDTAVRHFQRALQIDPGHVLAQANLRIVKAMQGDYRTAVQGVAQNNRHHAYNNAGYAALMRGEYELADQYLRRAMELSPSHHRTAVANLELIPD